MRKSSQGLSQKCSPKLRKYFEDYEKDLNNYEALASVRELQIAVLNSPIVLVGDYHTLGQAQRTVLRLVREAAKFLKRKKRKVVLALEMLAADDTPTVRAYLKGEISERTLLREIDFARNWGFSWPNYQNLFQFAKEEGLEIVGINSKPRPGTTLESRDKHAAKILAQISARNAETSIFVLMGDLHLASNHLPLSLKKELKKQRAKRRVLTIHQNHEPLYWKMVDAGTEQLAEVVRIRPNVYCLFNTPPWIKIQSHLHWVESTAKPSEWDYTDEIPQIIQALLEFFEIKSAPRRFEDYEAHGPEHGEFLRVLKRKGIYTKRDWNALMDGLDLFGFQFFPKEKHLYALSSNPNHWTELAARYLHSKLSGCLAVYSDSKRDFYGILMVAALAYLSSKILNPKRKCPINVGMPSAKASAEELRLTAVNLGKVLGEKIYLALLQNKVTKEEAKKLFFTRDFSKRHYLEWSGKLA